MKNHNIINVLDKELSCYRDGVFPPGETKEIIEFGLCEVNLSKLSISRTISIPVQPTMSSISDYCTELTGWTYAKLMKQGVSYAEACRRLRVKYGSLGRLVITDSSDELDSVKTQCELMEVEYPFGKDTLNISHWFDMVTGQKRNISLEEKLAHLGMQFEGTPHRAGYDATNIARVLIALIKSGQLGLKTPKDPPSEGNSEGRILLT